MSDTVLVTGGFGLVGSATVKRLAADGLRVVAASTRLPIARRRHNYPPARSSAGPT
jgi:UDP-glucose 4-epimerase